MFLFIDYHQSVFERPFIFTIYIEFHKNAVTLYFMMQFAFFIFLTILSLLLPTFEVDQNLSSKLS